MNPKSNGKIQVFREEPGFGKLFGLFKEKYRSLGRIGGTVSLEKFTDEELESIAGFLGTSKDKLLMKKSLSLRLFEKELANTSFSGYTLLQLMEDVLGEHILSKKEEQLMEREREETFIRTLQEKIPDANWWLERLVEKTPDTRWIWSYFKQSKEDLFEKILTTYRAITSLPKSGQYERLPFFSQRVTGNPHYFDIQEMAGKLLQHMLYVHQRQSGNVNITMPKTVEEVNDLLAEYGIFRDDLWNFVTCQQMFAADGGRIHPVWEAACKSKTVMNVPMKELIKVDTVWPASGKVVWILENSSVASTIMDHLPTAPIVCTHGQVRMAGWRLLDLLVQSGATLFYSGDMDPEGLLIADRIKRRYQEKAVLWKMDKQTYLESISQENISDRLAKLDLILSPELFELRDLIKERKVAGYQEAIVPSLIEDVKAILEKDPAVPLKMNHPIQKRFE